MNSSSSSEPSLLTDLDAFFTDHRRYGDLDAGVDDQMVWVSCGCGARMARRVDEGSALAFKGEPP